MSFTMKFLVTVFFYFAIEVKSIKVDSTSTTCNFSALFNFGDSNSDTGGAYTYFHNVHRPNGITVGKEFKRAGDGRLIIDFFADSLGFPYLNASADTNGTSFIYGANFAVGGSHINPIGMINTSSSSDYYHLDEQVSRFFDFKSHAIATEELESNNIYPKPDAFPEALYTIDIGQNDVNVFFGGKPVSVTLDYFTHSVQRLLQDGAKYLWVHNTCPLGCLAFWVQTYMSGLFGPYTRDTNGCLVERNKQSQDFNSELKLRIDLLRKQYPEAVITLVDMYSAKYQLISNPQAAGFDKALKFDYCCKCKGHFMCGQTNSTVCMEPSKYLSWDGTHWTEAANRILAKQIGDGAFSELGVGLSKACKRE